MTFRNFSAMGIGRRASGPFPLRVHGNENPFDSSRGAGFPEMK
jgi:hypothetical protein